VGQKTRRENLDMCFCLKGFVEENDVEKVTLEFISVSKLAWLIWNPGVLSIFQKR
jgi:hypothetical protein